MSCLTRQDADDVFFRNPRPQIQTQERPEGVEEVEVRDETPSLHTEVLFPERDEEPSRSAERGCREPSTPAGGDTEREGVQREGVDETAALTLQMSSSNLWHG